MYGKEKELQVRQLHSCEAKHKKKKPIEFVTMRCTSFDDLELQLRLSQNKEKSYDFYDSNGTKQNAEDFACLGYRDVIYASPTGHEFCVLSFLDDFQILKELGRGGFGTVYLAKHKVTEELRAMKIIQGTELSSIEEFTRLFQEVKVLAALSHPGIVRLFSSFSYHGKIVVMLEYIPGRTLAKFLGGDETFGATGTANKPISEDSARGLMAQLIDVTAYCHSKQYIHRDLKLENVMLLESPGSSPIVKLIDFGIAHKCDEVSGAGTLTYSAPEIVSGSCLETEPAIDVWGLGVILYCMVVGCFPFKGATREELRQNIISQPIFGSTVPSLSPGCRDLLQRMLEKDREKRIKLKEVLAHPWVQCKDYVPLMAPTPRSLACTTPRAGTVPTPSPRSAQVQALAPVVVPVPAAVPEAKAEIKKSSSAAVEEIAPFSPSNDPKDIPSCKNARALISPIKSKSQGLFAHFMKQKKSRGRIIITRDEALGNSTSSSSGTPTTKKNASMREDSKFGHLSAKGTPKKLSSMALQYKGVSPKIEPFEKPPTAHRGNGALRRSAFKREASCDERVISRLTSAVGKERLIFGSTPRGQPKKHMTNCHLPPLRMVVLCAPKS